MTQHHRGRGQVVLYADFDGCLHPATVYWSPKRGPWLWSPANRLFEHAALLEHLLAPHPGVCLVLSTAWVLRYGYAGTVRRLPIGLRQRAVGATFHSLMDKATFQELSRGQQVSADASRRKPRAWLALDDDSEGWPVATRDHLIETDPVSGISAATVRLSIERRLKELCR